MVFSCEEEAIRLAYRVHHAFTLRAPGVEETAITGTGKMDDNQEASCRKRRMETKLEWECEMKLIASGEECLEDRKPWRVRRDHTGTISNQEFLETRTRCWCILGIRPTAFGTWEYITTLLGPYEGLCPQDFRKVWNENYAISRMKEWWSGKKDS